LAVWEIKRKAVNRAAPILYKQNQSQNTAKPRGWPTETYARKYIMRQNREIFN